MADGARNVVLTGMMGTGKSTVAALVAATLGRPCVDTDAAIEATAGAPIRQLMALEGEAGFRRREAHAIRHAADRRGVVISVGGGAVLDPHNRAALRATGVVVCLDAEPAVLARRCARTLADRPLLAGSDDVVARITALRAERAAAYAAAADVTVDTTNRDVAAVRDAVVAWLHTTGALDAATGADAAAAADPAVGDGGAG